MAADPSPRRLAQESDALGSVDAARPVLEHVLRDVGEVVRDKSHQTRLLLAALLARGHVLIEDVPGVGKTTLVRSMARALGCDFSRIQFTADMLPSDVVGVQLWRAEDAAFLFKAGPIFSNLVLADELNRAPPKTQSALLEAMAERSVTVDDETRGLPEVFWVVATQNPLEHHGTYPLPESQLDRFTARLSLGYPSAETEQALLSQGRPRDGASVLARLDVTRVQGLQAMVDRVEVAEPVARYGLALVQGTRQHADVMLGASPRGGILLVAMARAWALLQGRTFVLPDDIQAVAVPVLAHRLVVAATGAPAARQVAIVEELLGLTPVPR